MYIWIYVCVCPYVIIVDELTKQIPNNHGVWQ